MSMIAAIESTKRANGIRRVDHRSLAELAQLVAVIAMIFSLGCDQVEHDSTSSPDATTPVVVTHTPDDSVPPNNIRAFCAACHAMPSPSSFPKDAWYHEVRRGFEFYSDSGRTDLTVPVQSQVVAWFRSQAPDELAEADERASPGSIAFTVEAVTVTDEPYSDPFGTSFTGSLATVGTKNAVGISDMPNGRISILEFRVDKSAFRLRSMPSADVANPAAIRATDLNRNGKSDLLIADLGSPLPADHDRGQVVWLADFDDTPASKPVSILSGIGRVADVQPADLDNDGDTDVVVAEFGWHTTGGIHVLHNETTHTASPVFRAERIDSRPGTIHVPVTDLNGDGRLDFIALISQEHEVIDAFLNLSTGFEKVRLYSAPDPSFGSSGIDLIDFDSDGDTDILYTNGDAFDSNLIKPYHGIQLLVNQGDLKFEPRHIADMPGVHRALAADMDRDGDLDIVAAALLPKDALQGLDVATMQAVIWLEQTAPLEFARHVIQSGRPNHAAMMIGDFDGNGTPDILAGCFEDSTDPLLPLVEIIWNRSP